VWDVLLFFLKVENFPQRERDFERVCFLTQPRSPGWCSEGALLGASCGDGSALEPVHPSRVGRGQEGA